jgi:hypothetical protein
MCVCGCVFWMNEGEIIFIPLPLSFYLQYLPNILIFATSLYSTIRVIMSPFYDLQQQKYPQSIIS